MATIKKVTKVTSSPAKEEAVEEAGEEEATPKKAAPKKAAPKKEAPKKADKPAPKKEEESEPESVEKVARKEIATMIREKINALGLAISERVANAVVVAYEEAIMDSLAEGKAVTLTGFGNFVSHHREDTERPNPQKPGEKIMVAAHNVPKFKAGSRLKAVVNQ